MNEKIYTGLTGSGEGCDESDDCVFHVLYIGGWGVIVKQKFELTTLCNLVRLLVAQRCTTWYI